MIAFDRDQSHLNVNPFFQFSFGQTLQTSLPNHLPVAHFASSILSFLHFLKYNQAVFYISPLLLVFYLECSPRQLHDLITVYIHVYFSMPTQFITEACSHSLFFFFLFTHFKRTSLLFICISNSWSFFMTFIIPKHYQFSHSSPAQLFATLWTAACQTFLSIINCWSLLKLISIKSVMPSNHLILCHPLLLPAFNLSQHQGLFKWVSSLHQMAKVL